MTVKKCPRDISFFFCTQHANNNVQRLLLANKCDAEDERRVWKDQGARVSFDFFFFVFFLYENTSLTLLVLTYYQNQTKQETSFLLY